MVEIHLEQIQDLDHFLYPDQGPDPSIIHNKYSAITVTIWGIQIPEDKETTEVISIEIETETLKHDRDQLTMMALGITSKE